MAKFGKRSLENLKTLHPDLKKVFEKVVEFYDCTIIEGHRGEEEQNEAFRKGMSKLKYPNSKHNSLPSRAADVVPYPINWKDRERFYHFAGFVKGVAEGMDISIRWGGDWDGDNDFKDQTFFDLPHFELV